MNIYLFNGYNGYGVIFDCKNNNIISLYNETELTDESNEIYRSYETITLKFNNICKVNKNNLIRFKSIRILDLSFNKLTIIEHDLFKYNKKLKWIYLSNNNIKDLILI